mmetsp:Transcript_48030/g.159180  ORF Transcript_48030/g.159180 Transcript_48030/m.159180 type:complete len:388 (+) Transcript_48030:3371-4534(+)
MGSSGVVGAGDAVGFRRRPALLARRRRGWAGRRPRCPPARRVASSSENAAPREIACAACAAAAVAASAALSASSARASRAADASPWLRIAASYSSSPLRVPAPVHCPRWLRGDRSTSSSRPSTSMRSASSPSRRSKGLPSSNPSAGCLCEQPSSSSSSSPSSVPNDPWLSSSASDVGDSSATFSPPDASARPAISLASASPAVASPTVPILSLSAASRPRERCCARLSAAPGAKPCAAQKSFASAAGWSPARASSSAERPPPRSTRKRSSTSPGESVAAAPVCAGERGRGGGVGGLGSGCGKGCASRCGSGCGGGGGGGGCGESGGCGDGGCDTGCGGGGGDGGGSETGCNGGGRDGAENGRSVSWASPGASPIIEAVGGVRCGPCS